MGAALAFEFARLLRDEYGLEPVHLFISGHRAPHIPYPGPTTYHLPEPEFIAALRSLKGTPEEILENPEMMQLLMPLLRSDFELIQTYELVPGPPLKCAFTALGGVADQEVERSHLAEWRHHTSGRFSTQVFPGDHFFLLKARRLLLQVISQRLMNS
jgi:medium-chain acyl-[acyl-carrier-protein] hydrolase